MILLKKGYNLYVCSTGVWYVFVILNTLQGLFIFVAFSCTKKVYKELRRKKPPSAQSTTTTAATSGSQHCAVSASGASG
jgi:hypothetical protein